ncbi:MAG: DUF493 domain-containing protein [Gammaproteobacteria bacterium]|nr:MAG: DUF493 domain-containing protein [Gammaproteobacteria bacterium]
MYLNEELWEFPSEFPLKVMGPSEAPLQEVFGDIIKKHLPEFDTKTLSVKKSRTGKHQSVTAKIWVTEKKQVLGLYEDLAAHQENSSDISLVL